MITNGTTYHDETPPALIQSIEAARLSDIRVRVFYGDAATGRDWCEEYDVTGRIGRSTGPVKITLLVHNARSYGGRGLLDNCIVKLMNTRTRRVLWQHPTYNRPELTTELDPAAPDGLPWSVLADGQVTARFYTEDAARRYIDYMTGARMNK